MKGNLYEAIKKADEGDYDALLLLATLSNSPEGQRVVAEARKRYESEKEQSSKNLKDFRDSYLKDAMNGKCDQ